METDTGTVDIESLHPMYAVAGLLVMSVGKMERWLYIVASTLELVSDYTEAEDVRAGAVISRLTGAAASLPEPDRAELLAALRKAVEALELRHALVHGILLYDKTKDLFESQRPPRPKQRREQADPANPRWIRHDFRQRDLIEMAQSARGVSSLIQSRSMKWSEALGLGNDV